MVGESRQKDDLVNIYKGATAANHAIYRLVDPTGKEIKATDLVSETSDGNEIWHGLGVTKNGFAIRFNQGNAKVRLCDNTGKSVSTNIDLAALTGKPVPRQGGGGDGAGFQGHGRGRYAIAKGGAEA